MRHWIIMGCAVILGTVVLFRSRVSNTSTISPNSIPGISVDQLPTSFRPSTAPATTRGVSIDIHHDFRVAPPVPATSPH